MTDLARARAIQKAMWKRNKHFQVERDPTIIHASALGDCLESIKLCNQYGELPRFLDERTKDRMAWGAYLEKAQEELTLPILRGCKIAHIGIPGKHGRFRAEDDGSGRNSPTFKLDTKLNLGGSVDRVLKVQPPMAAELFRKSGIEMPPRFLIPWEMKTIGEVTPAGGRTGEELLKIVEMEEQGTAQLSVPEYMFYPSNPAQWWLRKYIWQMLAYIHLWDAPVGLMTLLITGIGRIIPIWIFAEDHQWADAIEKVKDKARLVNEAVQNKRELFLETNWQKCNWCPYQQMCVRKIKQRDVTEQITNDAHIEIVRRIAELEPYAKEYDALRKARRAFAQQYLPPPCEAEDAEPEFEQVVGLEAKENIVKITLKPVIPKKTFEEKMADTGKKLTDPIGNPYWKYDIDVMPNDRFEEK